jgi:hypothetical protein
MAHTPGPWRFERGQWNSGKENNEDHSIGSIVGGDRDWYIATLEDAPEQSANARLIAAAPDLLAALKVLLQNRELGEVECQRLGLPRMIESCDVARRAIADAEGRDA